MGGNIAKASLTGVLFATVLYFAMAVVPFSPEFSQAQAAFVMPVTGYAFLVVCGLWTSFGLAVLFGSVDATGGQLFFPAFLAVFGAQWVVPMLEPLISGEASGVMAGSDLLYVLCAAAITSLILVLLAVLLFKTAKKAEPKPPAAKPAEKYKLKPLELFIKLLVLPVIYCVVYFLLWYFLLWRTEAARVYYSDSAELGTFMRVIINMLETNAKTAAIALLRGLLYALSMLPLLMRLKSKRGVFIGICVIFISSSGTLMLIPNPIMPDAVRIAHVAETFAATCVYALLCGLILHTCFKKQKAALVKQAVFDDVKPAAAARTHAGAAKPPVSAASQPPTARAAAGK